MAPNSRSELVESLPIGNVQNFWKAVQLSFIKPHTISRKLAGAEIQSIFQCSRTEININAELFKRIASYLKENSQRSVELGSVKKILKALQYDVELIEIAGKKICVPDDDSNLYFVISKLLPRNLKSNQFAYELIILDYQHSQAAFLTLNATEATSLHKSFYLELIRKTDGPQLTAIILNDSTACVENFTRHRGWVKHSLLPKLTKWMTSMTTGNLQSKCEFENIESLSLINLEDYIKLYNELKVKYGEHMVKIWPEQTDPSKFVYEDVAIAAYLLLLWRLERQERQLARLQSFADLGCGNGLLVHILSSEGHPGYGIDLRKRGIWDLYPSTTVLKVAAIVPSDCSLFPDVDWLVGNHSDELSPWIPVISARSSYESNYFLLPCCAYEFNGKKYQRRNSDKSQYMDFLQYAKEISMVCGFDTKIDRLKIPSTKRICLIGNGRQYPMNLQSDQCQRIQEYMNNKPGNQIPSNESMAWNNDFIPRSNVEKVQNCTKIDRSIVNEIIEIVFRELISKKRFLSNFCKPNWNVGGKIALVDLAKIISNDKLKALKSECGGLQTLLKNNSHIFSVIGGTAEIRTPMKWADKKHELELRKVGKSKTGKHIQFKQKPCWFLNNHPDGCPFDNEDCSYKHSP